MKIRSMKKLLATTLSAAMVMGMSVTAFAGAVTPPADGSVTTPAAGVDVNAPIYSYDIVRMVVPTAYKVAFNPDKLTVTVDGTANPVVTSNEQIVSKSYGIVNKSTKDKVVTVKLTVEDQNTNSNIEFVDSETDVDNAGEGDYAIYLAAVPADDTTAIEVGGNAADKDTTATAVGNVTMGKSTTEKVVMKAGENKIGFKLKKATYSLKSGASIDPDNDTGNDVASKFEITGLDGGGDGITAFTFDGKMNDKADWTAVTSGIKVTAVYEWRNAEDTDDVLAGTGAMVQLVVPSVAPTFTTGSGVGEINYTAGSGDDGLASITSIEMDYNGVLYDGYNVLANTWAAATKTASKITFDTPYITNYATKYPSDSTRQATVTYVNNNGDTETAPVNVKIR